MNTIIIYFGLICITTFLLPDDKTSKRSIGVPKPNRMDPPGKKETEHSK
ncbi:hypothetical protein [Macrococcoides caseolyticum]|nr:hypothetical protein [Macrococcus caseolyticus]